MRPVPLIAKRALDIVISGSVLVVSVPIILGVLLAIKLDSRGPVLSRGIAHCYGNRTIKTIRFRCSSFFGTPTRVGRLMSLSGLDRLPMLLNVLRGEMSIVGLHSYAVALSQSRGRASDALQRSTFKPGLFNWGRVQVYEEAGGAPQVRQQAEDDLFYVENWSLSLDAKILLTTLFSKALYVD
jgi:lipopolysaccharide/colanic/teichoic acid biosynthesis glycosyltransferase